MTRIFLVVTGLVIPRVSCHDKASLCRDRVFSRVGYSCCDRVFDVAKEFANAGGKYVVTKPVYVTTEFTRVGRTFFAIEDFPSTKLDMTESSVDHDRAWRAKASVSDST